MDLISTKKSREKWAKEKLEKLEKGYNKIHLGEARASFIKEKKDGGFSAIQKKHPESIFGFASKWGVLIITIIFSALFGAGIGFIIGDLFFKEKGLILFSIIGFVIGAIWEIWEIWDEIRFS